MGNRSPQLEVFVPQFDVKETKENYAVKADMLGVKEQDLEISLTGNRFTILGKKESEERKEDENLFVVECSFGNFSRTFTLPDSVDTNNIKAELKDRVLHIIIPKIPEAKPKKISIGQNGSSYQSVQSSSSIHGVTSKQVPGTNQ